MALVVPAYAAVNFSAVDNGDGTVSVVIDTADVVRGLALKVTCSDGATLADLTPVAVNAAFNTFIDYAFTTEAGAPGTYEIGAGHPFALANEAGVAEVGATEFSISMGVLDETGNQEGFVSEIGGEVLITFKTGAGMVCFELDTLRGGVVGDEVLTTNLDEAGLCVAVTEGVQDAISPNAPFYNDWVAFGKPACWAYKFNCRGDIDGKAQGNPLQGYAWVSTDDLNVLLAAYNVREAPKGAGVESIEVNGISGICADFDRAAQGNPLQGYARVSTDDLNILLASYNVREAPKGPGLEPCALTSDGGFINFYLEP
jgi:hypothetical protein